MPMTPKDYPAIETALLSLATTLGLKAIFSPTMPDYAYAPSPPTIFYLGHTPQERISNLAHDIAHYLIAAEYRRKKVDFGLGASPDSMENVVSCVSDDRAYQEELLASALGIQIERWAGADPSWTTTYHNWDSSGGGAQITVYLMRLCDRNLLHDDFHFSPERAKLGANL